MRLLPESELFFERLEPVLLVEFDCPWSGVCAVDVEDPCEEAEAVAFKFCSLSLSLPSLKASSRASILSGVGPHRA